MTNGRRPDNSWHCISLVDPYGRSRTMTRLLLDAMLGKLATYLRMCGHDAAYALDRGVETDGRLLALAREERRRLVTRDVDLAARAEDVVLLEARDVEAQLRELRVAGIELELTEPTRCSRCNADLERVPRDDPSPEYAPDPTEQPVWRCLECGQHFWEGSHWDDVRERVNDPRES